MALSSGGLSFPEGQSPEPVPVPLPTTSVTDPDVPLSPSSPSDSDTGDKPPFTDPVHVEYIVVPCPMYLHFPRQEQVEFFQNVPNNVTSTFQLSTLWKYCGNI